MQSVAAKKLVILLLLDTIRLLLLVASRHVAGHRLTFGAGFGAFNDYVLSWHYYKLSLWVNGKAREARPYGS